MHHLIDNSPAGNLIVFCPQTGCSTLPLNAVPYLEADWLTDSDPFVMLQLIEGKVSQRKLRLFACACVRRLLSPTDNGPIQQILSISEQFADGLVDVTLLDRAHNQPVPIATRSENLREALLLGSAIATASPEALGAARLTSEYGNRINSLFPDQEKHEQADLLREICGNPFQDFVLPTAIPFPILQLAEKVYLGQTPHSSLQAPLLTLGLPNVAAHFRSGSHPRGCCILDLILSKDR
jgi:hypothetical protein